MPLYPTPENFRAEMGRHGLSRAAVTDLIGMNPNLLSMYTSGIRPLTEWAAHNIGWAINMTTGQRIFDIDMEQGPRRPPRSSGRPRGPHKNRRRHPIRFGR